MEKERRDTGPELIRGRILDEKSGEILTYSRRDMEMLTKFENVLRTKRNLEEQIQSGVQHNLVFDPEGKRQVVFALNPQLVHVLGHIAFNMYLRYMLPEDHMREAADMMIHSMRVDKELSREFEKKELQTIWEQE